MAIKQLFFFLVICLAFQCVYSQNDTIKLKNGNELFGEIKKLRSGILTIETSYSDKDFTIDFSEVTELKIQRICFVVLTGGRRLTGFIRSNNSNEFTLTFVNGQTETIPIDELVILDELQDSFWSRFKGNIDLSFNLTKANNARQFNVGGGLSYRGPKWISSFNISSLDSRQDNTEDISRTDINGDIQRMLLKKRYLLSNIGYLSNTEQALDARYSLRIGVGRFLVLSNQLSWGLNAGFNLIAEEFTDLTPERQSAELYLGSELNMFDYKDWSLDTNINIFPSLSESGRWRIDYTLNLKWDLPYDFYFKSSLQFNYDNQAAATGSDFDYIITSGIGWSFD